MEAIEAVGLETEGAESAVEPANDPPGGPGYSGAGDDNSTGEH